MAEKTQMMMREMEKLVQKLEDKIEALAANLNNIGEFVLYQALAAKCQNAVLLQPSVFFLHDVILIKQTNKGV